MKKILLVILLMLGAWASYAQVPGTLSFQGILVQSDGTPVANGAHNVRFYFYTAASGGSIAYSSIGTGSGNLVTTYNGLFTFVIGSGTANNDPIPASVFSQQIYVELAADNVTLTPRIQLTTSPYANVAEVANSMDASDLSGTLAPARIAAGTIDNTKLASDIDASKLTSGTIPAARIGAGAIDNTKLASDLDASKLSNGTIPAARIGAASIDATKLAAGSVSGGTTGTITDASITAADLAAGSVSGGAAGTITDASIITADLADNAITNPKLADNAVANAEMADNAIGNAEMADNAVNTAEIAAGAVTSAKMAASSVSGGAGGTITDASITSADLAAGSVSGGNAGTITDASITSADLAAGSVSGGAAGTITDASITVADIADDAVTVAKIGTAGAADASKILTTDGSGNPQWSTSGVSVVGLTVGNGLTLTSNNIALGGALTTNATITSGGNNLLFNGTGKVGISSTTPASKFEVGGNIAIGNAYNSIDGPANGAIIQGTTGIGTSAPSNKLHVVGDGTTESSDDIAVEGNTTTTTPQISLIRTSGTYAAPGATAAGDIGHFNFEGHNGTSYFTGAIIKGVAETAFTSGVNVNGALVFATATSGSLPEKMRITSTGNVGIGINAPGSILHTEKSGSGNYHRFTESGALKGLVGVSGGGGDLITGDVDDDFVLRGATNMLFATGNFERMRISSGGQVGIGVNPTRATFEQYGQVGTTNAIFGGNSTGTSLMQSYPGIGFNMYESTGYKSIGSGFAGYIYLDHSTGDLGFSTSSATAAANATHTMSTRLMLKNNGRLGIGTTTPANILDVEGGVAIGATYSGTNAAPTNGLLVQGNVGIGQTTAAYPLTLYSSAAVIGASVEQDYAGASTQYGMWLDLSSATGTGIKNGLQVSVSGTAANSSTNYGISTNIIPNGTGNIYGLSNAISNVGTGGRWGVYNDVFSASGNTSSMYGVQNNLTSNGNATLYGTYNNLTNTGTVGTGQRFGTYNLVYGLATGTNAIHGEYNYVQHTGNGLAYGIYNTVNGNGTGTAYGIRCDVNKPATFAGSVYGLSIEASNAGTGDSYLLYANSNTNPGGIEWGLYVTGADKSYLGGQLGIGTTAPDAPLSVSGVASKTGGGTWATFSDRRLKKEVTGFKDGLDVLMGINPVKFKYNGLAGYENDGKEYIGVIAQDIQKTAPYTISTVRKKLNETDATETDLLMYDGSSLTYILVNSIKEQQAQIEDLKAQLAEYKTLAEEVAELKKMMSAQLKSQPTGTQSASSTVGKGKK